MASAPTLALAAPLSILTGDAKTTGKPKRLRIQVTQNDTLIALGDDALLLQAGTDLEVASDDRFIRQINLRAGRLMGVFKPDPAERTLINGPATAGIRGTGLYTHALHGERYLCCCYGSVDLEYAGKTDRVTSTYHSARVFEGGNIKRSSYGRPALHHDDELLLAERAVGRKPHWTLPDGEMKHLRPGPLPQL